MINAEKFRKELLELSNQNIAFAVRKDNQNVVTRCDSVKKCTECLFGRGRCSVNSTKWLLEEYKERIKLTKLEYDILKYLSDNTKYLYITRDRCNGLFLYGMEPTKGDGYWMGKYYAGMSAFNKLFQFIKWEDSTPTPIKDVLDNCEVVDDAEE